MNHDIVIQSQSLISINSLYFLLCVLVDIIDSSSHDTDRAEFIKVTQLYFRYLGMRLSTIMCAILCRIESLLVRIEGIVCIYTDVHIKSIIDVEVFLLAFQRLMFSVITGTGKLCCEVPFKTT